MFKIEVSNNEEMCLTKAHSKGKFSKVFFCSFWKIWFIISFLHQAFFTIPAIFARSQCHVVFREGKQVIKLRHLHISHNAPYLPPKLCITFAFHFSWVLQPSHQNLWGANKVHYGKCASGHFVSFFPSYLNWSSQWGLNDKIPNLHKKAKPWRMLVAVEKWRHRENGLLPTCIRVVASSLYILSKRDEDLIATQNTQCEVWQELHHCLFKQS